MQIDHDIGKNVLTNEGGGLMTNKELYMMLGAVKILLETNNADKAIELIKDTMALIDGTKKIPEENEKPSEK